ncbi:ABC transporter ATP-binding protein [Kribbella sp. NPDC050124]|uniref:ABC transporter ATP-binding protein n=1 Tax=Kribbella sp. NPDC050124 TaxID=3364114 RepID=UPI00379D977F
MTVAVVNNLTIRIDDRSIVDNVSFSLTSGSVTALVGASGSGKTTTALALLGEQPAGATVTGEVHVDRPVGYMPQQPSSALNPVRRVGAVLREIARLHVPRPRVPQRVLQALQQAQLPDGEQLLKRYPHQLSGGQQQRVVLAHQLIGRPKVLIADEPTTGQDALIRRRLAGELRAVAEQGIAILLLTHDLGLVRMLADHVLVMNAGAIVESGPAGDLLAVPRHPYTQRLVEAERIAAAPSPSPSPADRQEPTVTVRDLVAGHRRVDTLHEVSMEIWPGDRLAVVGRSGSGKTTLARCIAGLHPHGDGEILLGATPLSPLLRQRTREQLARIQYVHQDTRASFNEFVPVLDQVARTAERLRGVQRAVARRQALDDLDRLGVPEHVATRLPRSLSGGELQRAALVRAVLARPELLICDEITSGLDTVTQAELLDVLGTLQVRSGCALMLVTHDLSVVAGLMDRVTILDDGRIVEQGATAKVLANPAHLVTRALVTASTMEESLAPTR